MCKRLILETIATQTKAKISISIGSQIPNWTAVEQNKNKTQVSRMFCVAASSLINGKNSVWKPQEWVFVSLSNPKRDLFVFLIDPYMVFPDPPPPVTCDRVCHQLVNQPVRRVSPSERTMPPTQLWVSEAQLSLQAEWDPFREVPEDLKDPSVPALPEPDHWVRISIKGHRALVYVWLIVMI